MKLHFRMYFFISIALHNETKKKKERTMKLMTMKLH